MNAYTETNQVYLGEGLVHVPGHDSDFEEGTVWRGRLRGG
jgi:hypothetical protein